MSDNGDWRVGNKVRTNVYAGDRPVCQCHTEFDAALIASAVNGVRHNTTEQATDKRVSQLVNELKAARTAYHVRFGVPVSWEYARFLTAIGALEDLVAKGKL